MTGLGGLERIAKLEDEMLALRKQVESSQDELAKRSMDIVLLREELLQLKEHVKASKPHDQATPILDDEGLKELRRELDKIRTNMMPGLPVKMAKSTLK